jgi:predicted RNA-binding protein with PUA-like domain
LDALRSVPELSSMLLFRNSRLSVIGVSPQHYQIILRLAAS